MKKKAKAKAAPTISIEQAIEQKRAELLALEASRPNRSTIPTAATVVIPVHDSFLTLGRCLRHLAIGHQSVPLNLILVDNGSTDPCKDVLDTSRGEPSIAGWLRAAGFRTVKILPPVAQATRHFNGQPLEGQERINKNLEFIWKKLTWEASKLDAPYILYADSDVFCPVDGVRVLVETLDHDPKVVLAGIKYDWDTDHVQMGMTLGRLSVLKDVKWQSEGCPCRWLDREMRRRGYKVVHIEPRAIDRPGYGNVRMVAVHARHIVG
jgi:hypothetical protein